MALAPLPTTELEALAQQCPAHALKYEVVPLPDCTVVFFPRAFSAGEASALFGDLDKLPSWSRKTIKLYGKVCTEGRDTAFFSHTGATYRYSGRDNKGEQYPEALRTAEHRILAVLARYELHARHAGTRTAPGTAVTDPAPQAPQASATRPPSAPESGEATSRKRKRQQTEAPAGVVGQPVSSSSAGQVQTAGGAPPLGLLRFNSCLANRYNDGRDSMGMHADDEKTLSGPIASVSLGAERWFDFRHKTDAALKRRLRLTPGSLLVMAGATQQHYKHGVPKEAAVRSPRINLTFRTIK